MKHAEVMARCQQIVAGAGYTQDEVKVSNFLDYSDFVRDIIKDWGKRKKKAPWLPEFLLQLKKMRDDLQKLVEQDPLTLYTPAHNVALEFHQSLALIRYFRGGNRISKTQTCVADNYWVLTGQHPYRPRPPLPAAVAVIGVNFSKYAPKVYNPKYVEGEGGNPLSPVFPEGGKWFNRWDKQKHNIVLGCPECAEAGKAGSCRHAKSSIILFSDVEGPDVLQGGQYSQIQLDEQISYEFFPESLKRLETVPHSGLVVSETPLGGKGFWTHKILTRDAKAAKLVPGTDQPLVTLHTIDQFAAGLTSHSRIRASMEVMSPAEVEARVYGKPAAYSETGVFDHWELSEMQDEAFEAERGSIQWLDEDKALERDYLFALQPGDEPPSFVKQPDGMLRVWTPPMPEAQYILGCDVAQGLIKGDASCATVLRMRFDGYRLSFEQVAQLHGWINPRNYAEEVMKLALYYNEGIVVVERKGPGDETIRSLKEWGYWNLFRDVSDVGQVEFAPDACFGIDTNIRSKGIMVAMLQQVIKDRSSGERSIKIPCEDTLEELGTFGQEVTNSGLSIRFRGESGMPDDRVMSLVLAVYAAKAFGLYDFNRESELRAAQVRADLSQHEIDTWRGFREQEQA